MNKKKIIFSLLLCATQLFSSCSSNSKENVSYEIMECDRYTTYYSYSKVRLFDDLDSFKVFVEQPLSCITYYDDRINEPDFFDNNNLLFIPVLVTQEEYKLNGGLVFEELVIQDDIVVARASVGLNYYLDEFDYIAVIPPVQIYLLKIPKLDIHEDNYILKTFVRGREMIPSVYYFNR